VILLNKKIYHVVENHVIEIHVKQGTTVYSNTTTNGNVTISLEFDISEFSFSAIVFGQWAKIGKNRVINKVYIIQIDLWCEKR